MDGLCRYSITNVVNVKARRKTLSSDGRRWSKDSSTNWVGYKKVRFANCRGSWVCKNEKCPYMIQYGVVNRLQFDKANKCKACDVSADFIACSARRYTMVQGKTLKVFHCGSHSCPVIARKEDKPVEDVQDLLRKDPSLKPSQVQSALLVSTLRSGKSWEEIDKQARQLVDRTWISNQKQAVRRDLNPLGENFEGLVTFKHHCDKKDTFYVYKINDSRGNPDSPTYVFKTSRTKLNIANNMNKDSDHFLNMEFYFFDGKKRRCRNYTTLTASVYHPLLKKQISLAIMETEAEDSQCITLFWTLFQEALGKATSTSNAFNPSGWSTDMAGANLVGIKNVFGADALKRVKTCEFHFKQNRNKRARELDEESSQEFKDMCEALLVAQTVNGYTAAMGNLTKFINEKPERKHLETWLEWWNERREFIFNAFTVADGPKMNQAEVVHASWANRDRNNLSLLDVAYMDIRDNVLLEANLEAYKKGGTSSGRGPSFAQRNYRRELDQATRYGREIEELGAGNTVDGTSGHRPPEKIKKKGKPKKSASSSVSSSQSNPGRTKTTSKTTQSATRTKPSETVIQNDTLPIQLGQVPQQTAPLAISINNSNMNSGTIFSQLSTMQLPSTSTSTSPIWHSGMSPHEYELIPLPTNVLKCYGCGNDFVDKYRNHPYDIIVKHADRRVMRKDHLTGALIHSTDFSNTYYHPSSEHIRRKNPLFAGLVCLSSSLFALLSPAQKQVLEKYDLNMQII